MSFRFNIFLVLLIIIFIFQASAFRKRPALINKVSIKEKINDLIQYNVFRQEFAKTLRLISYESRNSRITSSNILLKENTIPILIGDNKPLEVSIDPRAISTGGMVGFLEMFKYVIVIWIDNPKFVEKLLENVKKTVNRRFDYVIVVTEKEKLLWQIMSHETIQGLRIKYGISLEKEKIWADPLSYNKGTMTQISYAAEIPTRYKMGGNLWGRHIKIAGAEFPPLMYKVNDEKKISSYAGTHVNVVNYASKKFNFTFSLSYELKYGEYWPNGTWTGMYARIFYPEQGFDCTIGLSYDYTWNYGVDFTSMTDQVELLFATNHPKTTLEWYAFLLPFSRPVWFCIIVTYIILGIVQFFVMFFIHNRKLKYIVWDSAIFLPYAMATEQGLCEIPKGARYLSLIWLLGTVVLGTGYKSTLRNNLSFPTPEVLPKTFEELSGTKRYGITVFTAGEIEASVFKGSASPTLLNIAKRMKVSDNLVECLRDVYMHHKTACIGWNCLLFYVTSISLTVNSQVEPLVYSKNTPRVNILTMAFQKDSILLDSFYGITESVFETGLIAKWKNEEYYKAKQKSIAQYGTKEAQDTPLRKLLVAQTKKGDSDRYPLSMMNLWVIFSILPAGVFLGMILFTIEHYIFNGMSFARMILKNRFLHNRVIPKW